MKKVLGMGAALVDILANVSDEWIQAQGVQKGGMNMVDWPQMEKFLGALDNPIRVPGGSTCNTMVGLSARDERCRYGLRVLCRDSGCPALHVDLPWRFGLPRFG